MSQAVRIKTVIIEDNPHMRQCIKEVLEYEHDIEVCGEAANLEEARDIIFKTVPDVAVVDISLSRDQGGLTLIKEMIESQLATRAVVVSAYDEFLYAGKSLQAGAKGYICKDKVVACLAMGIRAVHAGREFISSEIESGRP